MIYRINVMVWFDLTFDLETKFKQRSKVIAHTLCFQLWVRWNKGEKTMLTTRILQRGLLWSWPLTRTCTQIDFQTLTFDLENWLKATAHSGSTHDHSVVEYRTKLDHGWEYIFHNSTQWCQSNSQTDQNFKRINYRK